MTEEPGATVLKVANSQTRLDNRGHIKKKFIRVFLKRNRKKSQLPLGFPRGSDGKKKSAYNIRDPGLIPGSGRSPGEGKGYPLWYSCLENSMGIGAR